MSGTCIVADALKRAWNETRADRTGGARLAMASRSAFDGYKFRRQVPVGRYIVDFYCAELKLAVELDGAHHNTACMSDYDSARTLFLASLGIVVVRMPNDLTRGDGNDGAGCIRIAIAQITEGKNR